ncbi:hypothetical protein BOTBODRAFT_38471 [Botryobasidium botryosum FD-172 SS1]|uniref:Uncharacterized protein n=1 Tax=Botryobasidium botryosum (strain FD-172 SS1) TaxID=930990 RepID=A0A067LZH4_BOTB1|nr:hypothetical protein BOTBODRAFT_38471 [Botryobasidium botryosum FD-172 SS1]
MAEIELQPMNTKEEPRKQFTADVSTDDDIFAAQSLPEIEWWAWATAAWFALLAVPLLFFPRFLLFLSSPSTPELQHEHRDILTPLESFLSTHLGIGLLATALSLITSIPQDAPVSPLPGMKGMSHPLMVPLTTALLLSSCIAYNSSSADVAPLARVLYVGGGTTGLWGLWTILFAGSSSISKKTGADKRTSRFLFWNKTAASAQKKEWKQQQKRN